MDVHWLEGLRSVVGSQDVLTGEAELLAHSYDWWPVASKWRQQHKRPYGPDAVVRAVDAEQISRLLAWASANGVPVTPWGMGSSVTGAPLASGGITLDLSAMNRILAINETGLYVTVQAGKMGDELEASLNRRGYTLNHSPQSLDRSTVGGWTATLATGQFSSRWGGIEDLVLALTVVLPTGEIISTRLNPRAAIGPDIKRFFLGAEGVLGVVTEVTLRIFPLPESRLYETVRFPSVASGLTAMRTMVQLGLRPFLLRFYDEDESVHAMRDRDFRGCAMFVGCEGLASVAKAEQEAALALCRSENGETLGAAPALAWMERRFDFSSVENVLARPGGLAETIEVAHFWDKIPSVYAALKAALRPLAGEVLGHFSHVYPQGTSLYMILLGEAADDAAAEAQLMQIWQTSMSICQQQGAAISHHHGVGLARLPYIRSELAASMVVLERVKHALDPAGIMNPHKLGLD